MVPDPRRSGGLVLRLMVGLALLGGTRVSSTAGTWSVVAPGGADPGPVSYPRDLAVDTADNLYVIDGPNNGRIQRRDAQGNWSVVAIGTDSGQVFNPSALAVDTAGNLYVADDSRIQKREAQGNWSVLATVGSAIGQVLRPLSVAVDAAGNLYVADTDNGRGHLYTPPAGP